ncbi:hypothetical protein EH228_00775 [Erwinia endophytica]|uniref:hypothetical protein n=1 Tax=Erwinia endophytica TaxID=1563158 RepID=UPI001265E018|nr:hypothetical protein [Erwinia endophytica]KAB8313610.1 hypothetical protein EH228_00775 [Erwinia endophytica]
MKLFYTMPAIVLLAGCAQMRPVQQQSDIELCGNGGLAMHQGNTDNFFSIKSEIQRRKALKIFKISNDDCLTSANLAVNNAIQEQQRAVAISEALDNYNQQMQANRPKTTTCNTLGSTTGNVYGNNVSTFGNASTTCTSY